MGTHYTPDIWGYIVFAFPFVRSYVRSFVHLSVIQGQSFCVKVYKTSYFEDSLMDFIHIWPDGRYRSDGRYSFYQHRPYPRGLPWGQGHRLRIFIKKSKFLCLSLYSYTIKIL